MAGAAWCIVPESTADYQPALSTEFGWTVCLWPRATHVAQKCGQRVSFQPESALL